MHDHEKSLRRFRSLPDCRVVTAERSEDLRPEDLSDAEIYAGWVSPELVTPEGMDALVPEMDVVVLSLPGTDSVVGMFNERRLRLMKQSAILLNVGRGNAVVTDDLIRVMAEGRLRAACLDVMDPEPLL